MGRLLISASACLVLWLGVPGSAVEQTPPASRPNILLMFPDNLGWGEVNVYGGVRGLQRYDLQPPLAEESATTLIVEVTRAGVLGGPASTTRSVYRKSAA